MSLRCWIRRKLWGSGRSVQYVFVHPACGQADVEAGYLPEWGAPKFLCRRCAVAFDEARVRMCWQGDEAAQAPAGGPPPPSGRV
jgi:hypothetical protein